MLLTVEWLSHSSLVPSEIFKFLKENVLTDAVFHVNGERIRVHRVILAAASPFFLNMFCESESYEGVFEMFDVSADEMKTIISYIYNGTVDIHMSQFTRFIEICTMFEIKLDFTSKPKVTLANDKEVEINSKVDVEGAESVNSDVLRDVALEVKEAGVEVVEEAAQVPAIAVYHPRAPVKAKVVIRKRIMKSKRRLSLQTSSSGQTSAESIPELPKPEFFAVPVDATEPVIVNFRKRKAPEPLHYHGTKRHLFAEETVDSPEPMLAQKHPLH